MNRSAGPGLRSIRYQIALPLIAIETVVALAIAISGSWFASSRVEKEISNRFEGISSVVSNPQFPLTPSVLRRLNQLTGAQFIMTDETGRPVEASFPLVPGSIPTTIEDPAKQGDWPRIMHEDTEYFGLPIPLTGEGRRLVALYPVAQWRSARRSALATPILQGLCGFLAMAGVTAAVSRRISDKLVNVEKGVGRIASGHFDELATDSKRPDEIDHLAGSINHMSRQIQEMQRTIESTEKMRVLAQVASGLAHQLRNSIAGARMAIQLHSKRCPSTGQDDSLGVALRQLQFTEEQIRCLNSQDMSIPASSEAVNLDPLIRDVIELLEPKAHHTGTSLAYEPHSEELRISGQANEIRTAIFNLVSNAIEAARKGGKVSLRITRDQDRAVRLEIVDNGPGIAEAVLASAGQPFVTTKPEGLGLGLYLARQVAGRYGGELTWRREAESTIFEWTMPLARTASPAARNEG